MTTASELADLLRDGVLFTVLAEQLSGEPVQARLDARTASPLGAEESNTLEAGGRMYRAGLRRGRLITRSGVEVAQITAVSVTARIREVSLLAAWLLEHTSLPLGKVLAPLGVRREQLECRPASGNAVLETQARLWLPCPGDPGREVPVAVATERIMGPWLEWVSNRRANPVCSGV